MIKIEGAVTALITPFNENGQLDYAAFENLINWQTQNKIKGLLVNGTTGESPNLSDEELTQLITIAKNNSNNIPVIAGVGLNNTIKTIAKAKLAEQAGADVLMVICPYYNKPTQEGLFQHFSAVAEAVNLPIIIYNIPGRTQVNIAIETVAKLLENFDNIIGIKESSDNIMRYYELAQINPDFTVYCEDNHIVAAYAVGARGNISVLSNVLPDVASMINNYCLDKQFDLALQIFNQVYSFINKLFIETNPAPAKFALSKIGLCKNILRLPLVPIQLENESTLVEELSKFYEL